VQYSIIFCVYGPTIGKVYSNTLMSASSPRELPLRQRSLRRFGLFESRSLL
jgi:hypothetical protein